MSSGQSTEVFRPCPGWPGYRVSTWGRVQSCRWRNRVYSDYPFDAAWRDLKPIIRRGGYPSYNLCGGEGKATHFHVHVLVLEAFIGPKLDGQVCRHLDGNPQNNRLDNLCWGTPQENVDDCIRHGTKARGEDSGRNVLNEPIVRLIRRLHREGMKQTEIAKELNLKTITVGVVVREKVWRHVQI